MKTPAELFSLQGRVAVVISGTGELCGAMAEGFAKAGAALLLASDAGSFITGTELVVDGGFAAFSGV